MDTQNDQIITIFVSSAAFIVLLAILVILFLVVYQKRLVTQENRLQKMENERQQLLLKATIEGQERERKRLAKDLHDGIGSLLSGLSLNLKFQNSQNDTSEEQKKFLEEACVMVEEGISNIRRISHDLLPATLEDFGLVAAINECIQPIQNTGSIQVKSSFPDSDLRLSAEIELGVLRVFQELLQNTLKHANAKVIKVELKHSAEQLSLRYEDDGIGFSNESKNWGGGIGLKNMESRIKALNGVIELSGTNSMRAVIKVPLI